jgi:hypothetical protein
MGVPTAAKALFKENPMRERTRLALVCLTVLVVGLFLSGSLVSAQAVSRRPMGISAQATATKDTATPDPPEAGAQETPAAATDPTPSGDRLEIKSFIEDNTLLVMTVAGALGLTLFAALLVILIVQQGRSRLNGRAVLSWQDVQEIVRLVRQGRSQRTKTPRRRPSQLRPYLAAAGLPEGTRRIPLTGSSQTIGRSADNSIVITEDFPDWDTVSPHHARIYYQNGRWILEDLESLNGIYVEGQRTGRNVLFEGQRFRIGGVTLSFHLAGRPPTKEA